jgi:hypothetical protein
VGGVPHPRHTETSRPDHEHSTAITTIRR